jgi:predicted molibdopterin-dependent oxidoreductase YjgC
MFVRSRAGVSRTPRVSFFFDGRELEGHAGETLLTALAAHGILALRRNEADGRPRGGFCMMGVCQECLVEVAGRRVEACRVPVGAGLRVASLAGR